MAIRNNIVTKKTTVLVLLFHKKEKYAIFSLAQYGSKKFKSVKIAQFCIMSLFNLLENAIKSNNFYRAPDNTYEVVCIH